MTSPSENDIIEHIVLFTVVEDDEDNPTKGEELVTALNKLSKIESVLYLTAGPILRANSSAKKKCKELGYTHMLHGRYRTVSDLYDYSVHPKHLSVVDKYVRPLCADVMAVDWSSRLGDENHVLVPRPGSAIRLTCLQVEEEHKEEEFFERVKEIKEKIGPYEQVSYGKNFSERGKGFNVAILAIFPDLNELDSSEEYEDQMRSLVNKVTKGTHDGNISVDYVVPWAKEPKE